MTNIICITCPKGCHLSVDEENGYKVTGNGCPRGEVYGRNELQHPVRVITSTVRIEGAAVPRLSVKTDKPLPKEKMFECMALLDGITAKSRSGSARSSRSTFSVRTSISSRPSRSNAGDKCSKMDSFGENARVSRRFEHDEKFF